MAQKLVGVKIPEDTYAQFQIATNRSGFPTVARWLKDLGEKAVKSVNVRSWGGLDPGERVALWKEHTSRGAVLPPEFNTWAVNDRMAWLDKTFPLEAK